MPEAAVVDTRALQRIVRLGERRGVRSAVLLKDLPLPPEGVEARGFVAWDTYCAATERLTLATGGLPPLSALARKMAEVTPEYDAMLGVFGSTRQLFGFWARLCARIWPLARVDLRDIPDGRVRMTIALPPHVRDCPGFIVGTIGSLPTVSQRIGLDPADIEARTEPHLGEYTLRLPKLRPVGPARAHARRVGGLDAFLAYVDDELGIDGRLLLPRQDAEGREQEALDHASATWDLTRRQADVLLWLVRGLSNKEIAAELRCGERTVEVHVTALLRKARARSRTHVVTRFWRG